jgi:hypothetical protein
LLHVALSSGSDKPDHIAAQISRYFGKPFDAMLAGCRLTGWFIHEIFPVSSGSRSSGIGKTPKTSGSFSHKAASASLCTFPEVSSS